MRQSVCWNRFDPTKRRVQVESSKEDRGRDRVFLHCSAGYRDPSLMGGSRKEVDRAGGERRG